MSVSEQPVAAARRTATGLWSLVLAGVLWGTGGLTGSLLAHETGLSPLAVAAYRLATLITIGASPALVLSTEWITGRRRVSRPVRRRPRAAACPTRRSAR